MNVTVAYDVTSLYNSLLTASLCTLDDRQSAALSQSINEFINIKSCIKKEV